MKFIDSVFQKLRSHPKRVVFPEGTEPRILAAAAEFVHLQLGVAVLLGGILGYALIMTVFLGILLVATAAWVPRTMPLILVWSTLFLFLPALAK